MGMLESRFGGNQPAKDVPAKMRTDEFVALHGSKVLGIARRFSANGADADDAYQRSMMALLTKSHDVESEKLLPWILTVARNEALMIRREQARGAVQSLEALATEPRDESREPEEALVDGEQIQHGRDALMRINPDQSRCLLLRADGMRYAEIEQVTGFSYAKVHRCLSEGRRLFMGHIRRLDAGDECRRIEPLLSLVLDGEASAAQSRDLTLHLKSCMTCRTTMRDYRHAARDIGMLFPVGAALPAGTGWVERVTDPFQTMATTIQERLLPQIGTHAQSLELSFAQKTVAVTAIAASLAGGGLAVNQATDSANGNSGRQSKSADLRPPAQAPANSPTIPSQDNETGPTESPRDAKNADIAEPDVVDNGAATQQPATDQELFNNTPAPAPGADEQPPAADTTPGEGDAVGLTP